jgi:hypothetical protein
MTSNDELFTLYLSETDCPIYLKEGINTQLSKSNLVNILENDAAVEEAIENPESMLHKRLALNPFLEEDIRCDILEKLVTSNDSEKIVSDICQESYLKYNLVLNSKKICEITGTIVDWKLIRNESIGKLSQNFIEKYISDSKTNKDILDKAKNKIYKSN